MDKSLALESASLPNTQSITIALVAGEASGDLLGGQLIKALREHYPYARFVGIGGSEMIAQGLDSWYSLEILSVMGIVDVLKRLPTLLELRKNLVKKIIKEQPAVFIGIDAPDFNLGVAKRLRAARIKTVHYVSPSVWAWRQSRVVSIAQSVDLMLTLFPFEREFYLRHGVASAYVGHPAADEIPLLPSQNRYKAAVQTRIDKVLSDSQSEEKLQTSASERALFSRKIRHFNLEDHQILAILPGSRGAEVEYLMPVFLETAIWLFEQRPNLVFVVACANAKRRAQIEQIKEQTPGASVLPLILLEGGSRSIMGASDAVLLASGTATLEAMLLKKPMVVAYKWHWLTHFIISRLVKTPFVALPNILAQQSLVPELIQHKAVPEKIGPAVLDALNEQNRAGLVSAFSRLHQTLAGGASLKAAAAIAEQIGFHNR